MLSYLTFPAGLKELNLDISCNPSISDRDIVNLSARVPMKGNLRSASFNFDFCKRITEDGIEQLL